MIWGLGALFYLSGFYLRVAPAVMTSELMADFAVGAAGLGNLSAFYYYTYVGMQLPTGLLADLWGPRRLLATGALVAGLGTLLFAWAPTLFWAGLGRGLIGGSVAVAFVALLKVAAHWFPPRRFALVSGMALFSGVLGRGYRRGSLAPADRWIRLEAHYGRLRGTHASHFLGLPAFYPGRPFGKRLSELFSGNPERPRHQRKVSAPIRTGPGLIFSQQLGSSFGPRGEWWGPC